jgi:hypothetical protein
MTLGPLVRSNKAIGFEPQIGPWSTQLPTCFESLERDLIPPLILAQFASEARRACDYSGRCCRIGGVALTSSGWMSWT